MATLLLYLVATVATAFSSSAAVLLRLPLLHRRRHRRRVRRDQLRDRRADPGARARPRRPDHQRLLLARRRLRRARRLRAADATSSPSTSAGASRSASARSSAWASCSCAATCPRARAGCSSTAARRRPSGSSTRSSARSTEETGEPLDEPGASITVRQRRSDLAARGRHDGVQDLPEALVPRPRAVRRPGLHLQLGDLRPRHVPGRLLRHQATASSRSTWRCSRSRTSSARCCSGTCSTPSGASR